jgi:BirA family biotin operon repressor/biotin-[acetyl-CoA-carboxylase] ligase
MSRESPAAGDALSPERIRSQMETRTIGQRIVLHEVVASTNTTLRELAEAGAPEGTVVLAESQTAGRGRGAKTWFSPPGLNLHASILLKPGIGAAAAPVFTFIAPLALADAIRELGGLVAVKWPNDVLVDGRKVAGVRAELILRGDAVDHLILGVGVNLNVTHHALRAALGEAGPHATSLLAVLGRPVDRNAFIATFLTYLEEWLLTYQAQGPAALLAAWRDLDIVTGRRVEIRGDGTTVLEGRAVAVDDAGHLRVEDARGRLHTVVAGEIRLVD